MLHRLRQRRRSNTHTDAIELHNSQDLTPSERQLFSTSGSETICELLLHTAPTRCGEMAVWEAMAAA